MPEAEEALVFMLVALNGHWKIPADYFSVDGHEEGKFNFKIACIFAPFLL